MNPRRRGEPGEDELAYIAEHLSELQERVAGNEIRSGLLILWLFVGLIVNVVGFLWARGAVTDIDSLLADLVRTLGTAVWTGVVVVVLTQHLPDSLKGKADRQLAAYAEAIERRKEQGRPD